MCGIAGFVDPSRDLDVLKRMTDAVANRGPDDQGYFLEDGVGLGHRRLSIIDPSPLGHQPMRFENLVITYNGEIYNHAEIRAVLEQRGYAFTSNCDTEVILKAFHLWGPECVERFIGMFAFAVFDTAERALYLCRDRAGVKPLYYAHDGERLAFGSELDCFKPYLSADQRGRIDPAALSDFLVFGYVAGDRSIIEPVRKLPAAHYARFSNGSLSLHRYWQASFVENEDWRNRSEEDLLDELESIVVSAFRYRMVADVPVGVFLSAGVDSSLVTAVLARHHGQLNTFTIGFEQPEWDESGDARRIARHLGTNHREQMLTASGAADILADFHNIYDEPQGDSSGIPTTFVAGLAKASGVKVVLSADAGDELFGGYVRYVQFMARWQQVQRLGAAGRMPARQLLRILAVVSPARYAGRLQRYADLLGRGEFLLFSQNMLSPASMAEVRTVFPKFEEPLTPAGHGPLLNQMAQWDFDRYLVDDILVKVDRATMYHSIEGREPFLDHRLVEFATKLPVEFKIRNGETKYLLKKLLGRYLPEHLYRLPKRGFGVPMHDWVQGSFRQHFAELVEADNPLLSRKDLEELVARYRAGRPVNSTMIWFLFSFQKWYRHWMAA
jgi:asparagine synthase (glutamine-hydrolysing)